jgi:hypothetical protein
MNINTKCTHVFGLLNSNFDTEPALILSAWSVWCYPYYTTLYFQIGTLIMWQGVIILDRHYGKLFLQN